ncbi:MAG: hypothetical protein A2152_02920 [Candidatus Levybacteria bacterium RBG_16_35_6]|nr:MAG: hypothetical protein A2152_02920 [Candidatus Levybacteria bacterium RBG_16_35_6]
MNIFNKARFSLTVLALIGLISLFLLFVSPKTVKITADGNSVEASKYSLNVFDNSGSLIFSTSPLNDYFYIDSNKEHLELNLIDSNNGNLLDQFLITTSSLFFNKRILIWDTIGNNSKGKLNANYKIEEIENGIKLTRNIKFEKIKADGIGQVLKYCSGCIISDDRKRAFFNGDTITSSKTALASKLNLTAFALGENEFFLPGSKKIFIIEPDGTVKAEIDTRESEVFLQEKWNLLEFKTPLNTKNSISLTINIKV